MKLAKIRKQHYAIGIKPRKRKTTPRLVIFVIAALVLLVGGVALFRTQYYNLLQPVSGSTESQEIIIKEGALAPEIATQLHKAGLIQSEPAFLLYVKSKNAGEKILAGTYRLQPSLSTPEIVTILTKGKVATELVTILPGQRVDQIRESLIAAGFSPAAVDRALKPSAYKNNAALVDKPDFANLEGYIYPESFLRTSSTRPEDVIEAALAEMDKNLTPEIRKAFQDQGLTVYEGIILSSIVEREAFRQEDRDRIAQVFHSRLQGGMRLESDPTAHYGAALAGAKPSVAFSSAYNTYEIDGLPPTPISNVSSSSLKAVAYPAKTDWLFFVAGDDGKTHFSRTLAEHEALTAQYCTTLCQN